MIRTVQIRIIGEDCDQVAAAIAELRNYVGSARIAFMSPHDGRRGQALAYGTFQFDDQAGALPAAAPAPAAQANGRRAATGATKRIAATGKTRRLKP